MSHDANRSFQVFSSDVVIQAIGTEFDVRRMSSGTRVAVIEGLVQISRSRDPVPAFPVLKTSAPFSPPNPEALPAARPTAAGGNGARLIAAGEAVDVTAQGHVAHRETVDAIKAVAWRQRRLVFENDSLGDIAAEFNRYNANLKIRVLDEAASDEHYSGTFDADEPEALMYALDGDPALHVERIGNEIMIRGR